MEGKIVKNRLLSTGHTLTSVSKAMGIIPQTLHSLLKADDIKTGVLESIASAINKSVYFFYDDIKTNRIYEDTNHKDIESNQLLSLIREKDKRIEDLAHKIGKLETELSFAKKVDACGDKDAEDAICVGAVG